MSYLPDLAKSGEFTVEGGARPLPNGSAQKRHKLLASAALAALLALSYGAWRSESAASTAPATQSVPVTIETAAARNVRIWSEFSGRMAAVDSADIRPQVGGRITDIRFKDGQAVQAGDVLFVIDPQPSEAAVSAA